MQADWAGVVFETMTWRATGTTILRALDDVQMLLDDQIVKTQSMRASPYIGPFEDRVRLWESKLGLVQVGVLGACWEVRNLTLAFQILRATTATSLTKIGTSP